MNEIEPARPVNGQIVPRTAGSPSTDLNTLVSSAWPLERYRLRRQARWELFEEQLKALRTSLRLEHLNRLTRQAIDYHVQLADEVMARLVASDNPLIEPLLMQELDAWSARTRQLLSNFAL